MIKKAIIISFLIINLTSCIGYYDLKGMDPSLNQTVGHKVDSDIAIKKGEACITSVLLLFAFGDSSIEKAKREGYIKKITSVETSYKHFLLYIPVFQRGCTVVRGI
ncbi:MAG: hypothetical protein UV02_C0066G0009 [Candidatus Kuenenbacteria bacterium GW2011_GWA2_42_15]|uniref:TRL-like protein family n=1 Tax=Candidatus Kuenenbacteria bacterium GW2011_GWA2_42_15 TaxID=1618677 RepID=A0A0G1BPX1_9BACT|nr:MAG: hypothetical protein UV02_C0066G0009 [Candidatus Kuenenbacteria bacterium GW2011_GWA2_42_15]